LNKIPDACKIIERQAAEIKFQSNELHNLNEVDAECIGLKDELDGQTVTINRQAAEIKELKGAGVMVKHNSVLRW